VQQSVKTGVAMQQLSGGGQANVLYNLAKGIGTMQQVIHQTNAFRACEVHH